MFKILHLRMTTLWTREETDRRGGWREGEEVVVLYAASPQPAKHFSPRVSHYFVNMAGTAGSASINVTQEEA